MNTMEVYIQYSRPTLIKEAYNRDVVESECSHDTTTNLSCRCHDEIVILLHQLPKDQFQSSCSCPHSNLKSISVGLN